MSNKNSLDKSKIKILLLEGISKNAVELFNKEGYTQVELLNKALDGDELKNKIKDVHFIGIRSRTQLTADVLSAAQKLAAIGCFCIGTNQVDLKAARKLGVVVFNAPYSNTRSVAELAVAQAVLLLRDVPRRNRLVHDGGWDKSAVNCFEARNKTFGVIGYGSIGSQASVLAESFGMNVIYYDAINKLPLGKAKKVDSLDELLKNSDIVSLHVPSTAQTKNMIGEREISLMKNGSYLINAARGNVVDIDAVAKALESKHIIGAAFDVFPVEPAGANDEFVSPLRKFDNVFLTPHIGGSTIEAQSNIGVEVAEKLIKYSDNGSTLTSVNFPEVSLPTHSNQHRILHIHQNIPGVLGEINGILAANSINITAQYLQTNEDVGYVVIDVDAGQSEIALSKLQEVKGTLKARVLF